MTSDKTVSAHAVAALTLFDMRAENGAPLYLTIGVKERELLIDLGFSALAEECEQNAARLLSLAPENSCPAVCDQELKDQAKVIRSRLGSKLDGGDCIEAFFKSVHAYLDKPDVPRRLSERQNQIGQLSHYIIGPGRSLG